ncbi:MAG: toxin TcdB middle/N-terminal domain-containing protein, partial [Myxococcota bacterium]
TTDDTGHRFFLNVVEPDGATRFDTDNVIISTVGNGSAFRLGSPGTQILDVDGDGFTDLLNATSGQVLLNDGNGDWEMMGNTTATELAQAFAADFDAEDGELQTMKFVDYNGDKKIDVIRSTLETTTVYQNLGLAGFEVDDGVQSIGAGFAEEGLQFSDMNGDGLLDVVRVRAGSIQYRLNYGWGSWGDWVIIDGLPISDAEVELAELEDINGDGLSDLVIVTGNSVKYALNTNTNDFADTITLVSNDVDGEIPNRIDTTVLYADMNANGSSDIVWISNSGVVNALELFPVRPNLLTRITNGIGQVTDVTYSSSVQMQARDAAEGRLWSYKLPHPMLVVESINRTDTLTNLDEIDTYAYHDGYYDGDEKQFRGYEEVELVGLSDETQEERQVMMRYEIGAADPYRKDLLVYQSTSSAGRLLNEEYMTYDDCPLAEIQDGTELPVRYICPTATRTVIQEGASEDRWVVTETASTYDGYGNVTRSESLGVTSIGGGSCEPCGDRDQDTFGVPCGAQCLGDESYTVTDFVEPGEDTSGRWILGLPWRSRSFGRDGSELVSETLTYYDGNDFEGMNLGTLDQGKVTRVTVQKEVGSNVVIETARNAFDEHGNVIDTLDPL